MACECCKRYAPRPIEGEQGPCDGDASIEEARKWALIWKSRAREAGWDPGGGGLGGFVKDALAEVTQPEPEEAVLTDGLARAIEQGKTEWNGKAITYCAGKRRHGFLEDTPMLEQLLEKGCFHCHAFPEVQP